MNFVPWWQDEFLRSRIVALGWTLMIGPAVFAVASRWFDPIHPIDVRDSAPALISMAGIGVVLLVVERYLRPRRHHAQVLLVEMPDRAPYYFSICECRWFGGVHHDAATPFRCARKHTDEVDDEVVRVFDKPQVVEPAAGQKRN